MAYSYPFKTTDEETKSTVWAKGKIIPDRDGNHWDPAVWRYDTCGSPMKYADHGDVNSKHGWEIDHIKPTALGGQNTFDNLQPVRKKN